MIGAFDLIAAARCDSVAAMRGFLLRPRRLRRALPSAVFIGMLAYFLYHAVQGEHGLLALRELNARAEQLQPQAVALAAERRALEARLALLQPDSLDPDMLDEQARRRLGFLHPDEIVILNPRSLLDRQGTEE